MTLTVAVITFRSATRLPDLIASLPDGLAGIDSWRLVIVDSGSDDETVAVARRLAPEAEIIQLPANLGFAAAVNAAAAADTLADHLLILSQTARLRPGCVRPLLAAMDEPAVGVAVPRLYRGNGRMLHSLRRRPSITRAFGEALLGRLAGRWALLGEIVTDPEAYRSRTVADWATGGVTLVSRKCLDTVGKWDESYFLYSEETDFELRAADAGFQVVLVPEAESTHLGGDSQVNPVLHGVMICNKVRLYARRNSRSAATVFWAAVTIGYALRSARPGAHPSHRYALGKLLKERRALVRGLPTVV